MREALKELLIRVEFEKRVKKLLSDGERDQPGKVSELFCESHV